MRTPTSRLTQVCRPNPDPLDSRRTWTGRSWPDTSRPYNTYTAGCLQATSTSTPSDGCQVQALCVPTRESSTHFSARLALPENVEFQPDSDALEFTPDSFAQSPASPGSNLANAMLGKDPAPIGFASAISFSLSCVTKISAYSPAKTAMGAMNQSVSRRFLRRM